MKLFELTPAIRFDETKFSPVMLLREEGFRMAMICLKAGQEVPEHGSSGHITAQVLYGRVTFYEENESVELTPGNVLRADGAKKHRVVAHEDSVVLAIVNEGVSEIEEDDDTPAVDLREIPRPERHRLVFEKIDALAVQQMVDIVNDHDPIHLLMQIDGLCDGEVRWGYLVRGPHEYRIRIQRIAPAPEGRQRDAASVGSCH